MQTESDSVFGSWEAKIKASILAQENINSTYALFLQGLEELKNKCVPTKKRKAGNQPGWFTNRIRNALKKQKKLYSIKINAPTCYNTSRYETVRKHNQKAISQAKKSFLAKKLYKPLACGDSKSFYGYVRQSKENSSNIIPNLTSMDVIAKLPLEKASLFNKFF